MNRYCLEYIWHDADGESRSKTMVVQTQTYTIQPKDLTFKETTTGNTTSFLHWNYDGSSTGQADSDGDTELTLVPVFCVPDVLRTQVESYLVLCDVVRPNNTATERSEALKIFHTGRDLEPWFGLEQEYILVFLDGKPLNHDEGKMYCGVGHGRNPLERTIAEQHLAACMTCGLNISGINAEVAPGQWEFQIGPSGGVAVADELMMARYLLERIAEQHGARVVYDPKPHTNMNGSGCHVNFSTIETRQAHHGLDAIHRYVSRLSASHDFYMQYTGKDNYKRLTGRHETSDYRQFSYGVGTRNTSVRIGNQTAANRHGYFEDRRPAANVNPYTITSLLFKLCCL